MNYLKLFENIDYNNLVISYNTYISSKKKYQKILNEIEPFAIWIYKTIWEKYGTDYLEHDDIDGDIEDLSGDWDDLFLDDIDVDKNSVVINYKFEIEEKYGDNQIVNYYLELNRKDFELYNERFEIEKETKKYNL